MLKTVTVEFVAEKKIANLSRDELFEFIIERVLGNRILLLEKIFAPDEKLEFLTKGLELAQTNTSRGINMVTIPIETTIPGRLRSKQSTVEFNLFAPGTSEIEHVDDGYYSVKSFDGDVMAQVQV